MWHHGYGMSGIGWFGWLPGLFVLILIVIAIVFLVRMFEARAPRDRAAQIDAQGPPAGEDSALRILRERYARGEIDPEQFQQRQRDLR
jgi:putative membrane protein